MFIFSKLTIAYQKVSRHLPPDVTLEIQPIMCILIQFSFASKGLSVGCRLTLRYDTIRHGTTRHDTALARHGLSRYSCTQSGLRSTDHHSTRIGRAHCTRTAYAPASETYSAYIGKVVNTFTVLNS